MIKQRKDILKIKKYLDGELDAQDMYDMERRAQEDPFLMEALERYETTKKDQQKNLDDVSIRLRQRVEKKEPKVIAWKLISVAAIVLIILAAGTLWFINRKNGGQQLRAVQTTVTEVKKPLDTLPADLPQKVEQPVSVTKSTSKLILPKNTKSKTDTAYKNVVVADVNPGPNMIASEPPSETMQQLPSVAAEKDKAAASINEMVATTYTAQRKTVVDSLKNNKFASATPALQGRTAGVIMAPYKRFGNKKTITGTVTSKNGGQPIIGAVVKANGMRFGVVTDLNGRFVLPDVPDNASILVNFIGYETQKIELGKKDSLGIVLTPSASALRKW